MKNTKEKKAKEDLKYSIEWASEVYKEFSEHLEKHRQVIMKYEDLQLWWNGYKKGIEDILDDVEDYEFENETLRVAKHKNTKIIVPKDYYEHHRKKVNTKASSWTKVLRRVGNSFLKLFKK